MAIVNQIMTKYILLEKLDYDTVLAYMSIKYDNFGFILEGDMQIKAEQMALLH